MERAEDEYAHNDCSSRWHKVQKEQLYECWMAVSSNTGWFLQQSNNLQRVSNVLTDAFVDVVNYPTVVNNTPDVTHTNGCDGKPERWWTPVVHQFRESNTNTFVLKNRYGSGETT